MKERMNILSDIDYMTVRSLLHLDAYPEIANIDRDLLSLAFVNNSTLLHPDVVDRLMEKYGLIDYQWIEFIGDSILSMIITTSIPISTPGLGSITRSRLVNNKSLSCLMNSKGLCRYIVTSSPPSIKVCADCFEAIIGSIYYHLYYIKDMGSSCIDIIRRWMFDVWKLDDLLSCPYDTLCSCISTNYGDPLPFWEVEGHEGEEEVVSEFGDYLLSLDLSPTDRAQVARIVSDIDLGIYHPDYYRKLLGIAKKYGISPQIQEVVPGGERLPIVVLPPREVVQSPHRSQIIADLANAILTYPLLPSDAERVEQIAYEAPHVHGRSRSMNMYSTLIGIVRSNHIDG